MAYNRPEVGRGLRPPTSGHPAPPPPVNTQCITAVKLVDLKLKDPRICGGLFHMPQTLRQTYFISK